jgi:hypothetical protein
LVGEAAVSLRADILLSYEPCAVPQGSGNPAILNAVIAPIPSSFFHFYSDTLSSD